MEVVCFESNSLVFLSFFFFCCVCFKLRSERPPSVCFSFFTVSVCREQYDKLKDERVIVEKADEADEYVSP